MFARSLAEALASVRQRRDVNPVRPGPTRADAESLIFHVVVVGIAGAGRTAMARALVGPEAVPGTSSSTMPCSYELTGAEGTLIVTDTPALPAPSVSTACAWEEPVALVLAAQANLLLCVVDRDPRRTEIDAMVALLARARHSMVVLNKQDRLSESDRRALLERLNDRLVVQHPGTRLVSREDVVSVAAAPVPLPTRVRRSDGVEELVVTLAEPDLTALEERIEDLIRRVGPTFRAGNLLLRTYRARRSAEAEVIEHRRRLALSIIERYQWLAAATVFAVPVPIPASS